MTGRVRGIDRDGILAQLDAGSIVLLSPLGYSPTGEVFNLALEDVAVQADRLYSRYRHVETLLAARFERTELAYQRAHGLVNEVCLGAVDNLTRMAAQARSVAGVDGDFVRRRLDRERQTLSVAERLALKRRLELVADTERHLRELSARNEAALTALDDTAVALARVETQRPQASVAAERAPDLVPSSVSGLSIRGMAGRARAFVKVQDGCGLNCSFCIIPTVRGSLRSRAAADIVAEVRELARTGYREIVLTGVDITSYGGDLPGTPTLGDLSQKILKHVPGLDRLRLVRPTIAAHIDGAGGKSGPRDRPDLMAPGIPAFRKTMDHQNERTLTRDRAAQAHLAGIDGTHFGHYTDTPDKRKRPVHHGTGRSHLSSALAFRPWPACSCDREPCGGPRSRGAFRTGGMAAGSTTSIRA